MRWLVVVVWLSPAIALAQRWQDATASCVGTTAEWSSKIEVADVDGDGQIDILVPNGGNYSSPGAAEPTRIWKNLGNWSATGAHCSEISAQAVGGFTGLSRMIKVADVDGDGDLDILTGGAWHTQLKLYLRDGAGWTDASAQLPQQMTAIGDAELGDVDGDGDLDIVLVDWGTQNPGVTGYAGGPTRLYLNDGTGHFTDVTQAQMPAINVKWSWDVELVDVDNDWDLDILVSCKLCTTSYLFRNDGHGQFTDDPNALPHYPNNYEFEAMDIDGDGYLDLATINDGPNSTDHLFHNKGDGTYADETSTRLAGAANPAEDDNAAVWLDADNDGDADLLIASLSGPDRLSLNDGHGHFTLASGAATPNDTPGSLGIAVADLNGDGRLDVVQAQGEVDFPEKVQLATNMIAVDTQPPAIRVEATPGTRVHARVHDHQSPSHLHDWKSVVLRAGGQDLPMHWYGEYLWYADLPSPMMQYEVCATDRAGNMACAPAGAAADAAPQPDAPVITACPDGSSPCTRPGCGCHATTDARGSLVLLALVAVRLRRRRKLPF